MKVYVQKPILWGLILTFLTTFHAHVQAGEVALPLMPKPGTMVQVSSKFTPAHLQGIIINPKNALQFDFIMHQGDSVLTDADKQQEYLKIIKYFLAAITVPDKDQWVNLSPYEKDRIIESSFGNTEMGRDLLAQDYLLKQITSSLMYPETGLGKEFWNRVYEKANLQGVIASEAKQSINTFNKVWIIADKAEILESGNTAYVQSSHLRVMLEQDYLAKKMSSPNALIGDPATAQIIRDIILPELEREVNEGKNFAQLRQVYSAMILATWYKKSLKESLLNKVYANKSKINGVDLSSQNTSGLSSPNALIGDPERIYQQYLAAFKKGVFNYIKEDIDATQQPMPRKYFAGGAHNNIESILKVNRAMTAPALTDKNLDVVTAMARPTLKSISDNAMSSRQSGLSIAQLDTLDNLVTWGTGLTMLSPRERIYVFEMLDELILRYGALRIAKDQIVKSDAVDGDKLVENFNQSNQIRNIIEKITFSKLVQMTEWETTFLSSVKNILDNVELPKRADLENVIVYRKAFIEQQRGALLHQSNEELFQFWLEIIQLMHNDPSLFPVVNPKDRAMAAQRSAYTLYYKSADQVKVEIEALIVTKQWAKARARMLFRERFLGKSVYVDFMTRIVAGERGLDPDMTIFVNSGTSDLIRPLDKDVKLKRAYETLNLKPSATLEEVAATTTQLLTLFKAKLDGRKIKLPEYNEITHNVKAAFQTIAEFHADKAMMSITAEMQKKYSAYQAADWARDMQERLDKEDYIGASQLTTIADKITHSAGLVDALKYLHKKAKIDKILFLIRNEAFDQAGEMLLKQQYMLGPEKFEELRAVLEGTREKLAHKSYYSSQRMPLFENGAEELLNLEHAFKTLNVSQSATLEDIEASRERFILMLDRYRNDEDSDPDELQRVMIAFMDAYNLVVATLPARDQAMSIDRSLHHKDEIYNFDVLIPFNEMLAVGSLAEALELIGEVERGRGSPNLVALMRRLYTEAVNKQGKSSANKDSAQVSDNLGGIDMNADNLDLVIKRDGKGMPLPVAEQDLAMLSQIDGFTPQIIAIKPASALANIETPVAK